MLNILHKKINQIVPIVSISDLGNSNFNIEYVNSNNITNEQYLEISYILSQWPLESMKLTLVEELNKKWQSQINNGWVTPFGWKLGLQNNDITLLTGSFILAKEMHSLGLSTEGTVVDTDGISHNLQISQLTTLMLQYGQYRSLLSNEYANKKQSIEQSQSIEELNNIII